jgi:hypothetical protein
MTSDPFVIPDKIEIDVTQKDIFYSFRQDSNACMVSNAALHQHGDAIVEAETDPSYGLMLTFVDGSTVLYHFPASVRDKINRWDAEYDRADADEIDENNFLPKSRIKPFKFVAKRVKGAA